MILAPMAGLCGNCVELPGNHQSWPRLDVAGIIGSGSNAFALVRDVGVVKLGDTFAVTNKAGVFVFTAAQIDAQKVTFEKGKCTLNPTAPSTPAQICGGAVEAEKPEEPAIDAEFEGLRDPFLPASIQKKGTDSIGRVVPKTVAP